MAAIYAMKQVNLILCALALIVGVHLTGSVVSEAVAEARTMNGESIASLPFEKRVCRLGFDCLRPVNYDPLQGKHVPRQPMYGLTPEEIADIVAEIGADLWCIDMHYRGVSYASEMVKRDPHINPEHVKRMVDRAHEHGIWVLATSHLSDVDQVDLKGEMDKWKVHSIDDGRNIPLYAHPAKWLTDRRWARTPS